MSEQGSQGHRTGRKMGAEERHGTRKPRREVAVSPVQADWVWGAAAIGEEIGARNVHQVYNLVASGALGDVIFKVGKTLVLSRERLRELPKILAAESAAAE